jgi:ubiquinone/menaquinone biosynthesis C-methylase UbiE
MLSSSENLQSDSVWDLKWSYLFEKYQSDLRHAYYIKSLLNKNIDSVLEIAAGSFRDIAFIGQTGLNIKAFDFSKKSIELAKNLHPEFASNFFYSDAFKIDLKTKSIDASYSNGFLVLFDDHKIKLLLDEQERVTRKQMFVTLHNGHNKDFENYFLEKRKTESIYNIRFFKIQDIEKLFNKYSYVIYPVGKAYKSDEDILISEKASFEDIRECIISQGLKNINKSERLLVMINLDLS